MSSAGPERTFVVDLGGVLVDWDPRYPMAELIGDPERHEWFLAHVCDDGWLGPVDRGEPRELGMTAIRFTDAATPRKHAEVARAPGR